jgi:hypothetical protein
VSIWSTPISIASRNNRIALGRSLGGPNHLAR